MHSIRTMSLTLACGVCALLASTRAQDRQGADTKKGAKQATQKGTQDRAKAQSRPSKAQQGARPKRFRSGGYFGLWLEERGEKRKRRVVIADVRKGSDAEKLGFKKGDVLLKVNGQRVRNGDRFIQMLYRTHTELMRKLGRAPKPDPNSAFDQEPWHTVTVLRDGKRINLNASLPRLDVHPKVGQIAPDFTAKSLDGKRDVNLHEMLGKRPLVLIFGSFT